MDIITPGPLRLAGLRFQLPDGAPALTVVCKATFTLRPGESPLAAQQDAPAEDDTYWDDDPQRSLSSATDLVPFKERVDVVVVGYAFSRAPARSVVARLSVGTVDKAIEVHNDRAFGADGVLREGSPFTKMRLRWERAAGGPETSNPVGMRFDQPDARGNLMLPNLQPLTATMTRHGDTFEPIGFGPIAPLWPERLTKIHRSALGWSPYGWTQAPLPEGLDPGYFNVAPLDQQLDALPSGVPLFLEHLHAEHDHLSTQLAEVVPRAVVERPGQAPQALALVRDTLTIDTDRGICHLVWRGTVRLSHPQEVGRIVVSAEDAQRVWDPGQAIEEGGRHTLAPFGGTASPSPAMPFARASAKTAPPPPAKEPPPPPRAPLPSFSSLDPEGTRVLTLGRAGFDAGGGTSSGTPFAPPPPPSAPSLRTPTAPPPPTPRPLSAGPLPPPAPSLHVAPPPITLPRPPDPSPWAAAAPGVEPPPFTGSIGERLSGEPQGAAPDPPPPPPARAGTPAAQKPAAPEAVDLLWFDAESVARIRRRPPWRVLLTDLLASSEIDSEEGALGNTPEEIEDRRDVLHVLVHGAAVGHEGIAEALSRSVRADGKVIPPLVLAAGHHGFTFDELEMLKATLSAALPFAPGDEPLTAATATAKDFLATPGLLATGTVIESLTTRIREAFVRVKRPVPPEYLTVQGERALLEKRCYQKREVFSKTHVRGVFAPPGAEEVIPIYLPEEVSKKLPLYQRFAVRLVVEVHRAADQVETHPAALRALAVGRTLPTAK